MPSDSAPSKPIIGLCGGIGAGKSSVARVFAELGGLVIDSDAICDEIQRRPEIVSILREWWGDGVIADDGGLDRRGVGRIVFARPTERKRLESLLYPLIAERRQAMIMRGLRNPAVRAIILDSPLLFESNLDRLCDSIVFVDASESQRLERVRKSRGWDERELRKRERWQLPLAEKRARCAWTIRNEGSPSELRAQAVATFNRILDTHRHRTADHN